MIGQIYEGKSPISRYQPSQEIADFTGKVVKRDYQTGFEILHRSWPELNNYSVIDRDQKDQRTFNSFVDESVDDPNEAWKWRGTRGEARKRVMGMHAQLTANYMIPLFSAQNDEQEEDREISSVMRDGIEWMTVNSNYRPMFLAATMGMLVNSVTYLNADFCRVFQIIKEKTDQGYETKRILDEVLSGFQANVYSSDQVLITNTYEQNIQKHRANGVRKFIDYTEAEAKYGNHPNWEYVEPGIRSIYNEEDGLFYDIKDEDHPFLVEELTHKIRREDSEVCYINGIYFGNENIEANPIKHRDNRNAPKYNLTPFGYQRINEHFFFYKSLVNIVGWDDKLYDALTEVTMNREFLDLEPPTATSGNDKLDTSVIFPGANFSSNNPDFRITSIIPPSSGRQYQALKETRDSMADASVSDTTLGQLPEASQKAFTVQQAAQNASIIRSGVLKTLGQSVLEYGSLMADIFIQHISTAEVDEITGNLKYRSLLLHDQVVDGRNVSKRILFDEAIMGSSMDQYQKKQYMMKLLNKVGYPDNKEHLYVVNPALFSKMKYLVRIDPDTMEIQSQQARQILAERLYALLQQNPYITLEALTRDLLQSYRKNPDDFIKKQEQQAGSMQNQLGQPSTPPIGSIPGVPTNMMAS